MTAIAKESAEQIAKRLGADLSLLASQMGADLGDPKVVHTLFMAVMAKSIALSTSHATNLLSQLAKDSEHIDTSTRVNLERASRKIDTALSEATNKLRDSSDQIVANVQRGINRQFAAKERTSWAIIIAAVAISIMIVGWVSYRTGNDAGYQLRSAEVTSAINRCAGGQILSDANGAHYCQWKLQ